MLSEYKPYYNIGPGDFINEELGIRGWQQTDLAEIIGMSKKSINKIIKNKQSITIDTAKQLSKVFGQSPQYWINLDTNYRLRLTENNAREDEIAIKANIYKYMPINEMVKRGWIAATNSTEELINEIKNYWNLEELNLSFFDKQILPNFRKSEAYESFNQYYALSWFQMAKRLSKSIKVNNFNKKKLRELSTNMCNYSNKDNGVADFLYELNKTGVKFIVLKHLPKTYTDGAAFRDGHNPAIVYTCRYDRIDHFWFTVAHEIGHILLHLKKQDDFIIDESNKVDTDDEKEANTFASKILKEDDILKFFSITTKPITKHRVITCSTMIKAGEAIIVGILQHHGKLPWTHLKGFTKNVSIFIPKEYWPEPPQIKDCTR